MLGKRFACFRLHIMFAAMLLIPGLAFSDNNITVVSASGQPGSDITLQITVTSTQNVAGAAFDLMFDKTKLQVKAGYKGSAASHMTVAALDLAGADTTGKLAVQMFDSTLTHPVAAGTSSELFLVTLNIDSTATGDIPVTISNPSLSDPAGASITFSAVNGTLTAVRGQTVDATVSVNSPKGPAGTDVQVSVTVNSTKDIYAAAFNLLFDPSKLQIKSAVRGVDAPGADTLAPIGVDIPAADSTGKLEVWLVDFNLNEPTPAGQGKVLFNVTFTVAGKAPNGDYPLSIANVDLGGIEGTTSLDLVTVVKGGKVTVGGVPGDSDGNGKVDIFDLLSLLKVLGGSKPATAVDDIDHNGKVDIFDLLALLKLLAK
jgi:hypothetical protein